MDKAKRTQDDYQRVQFYRQANAQIMDDLPVLPMLNLRRGNVCYHPRVRGFRNPSQDWNSFKNVWMDPNI
jgi:peptide/nickel transport system substrate-binding protein